MRRQFVTSRQVRNALLRSMGVAPAGSYQSAVRPGDVVRLEIVTESRGAERIVGRAESVLRHGHYNVVRLRCRDGAERTVRLWLDGPRHWGVTACAVVRRRVVRRWQRLDLDGRRAAWDADPEYQDDRF